MKTGTIASKRQETEVAARAERRRYTIEYKLKVLREADRAKGPGEIGAQAALRPFGPFIP